MSAKTKAVLIGGVVLGALHVVDAFLDLACESILFPLLAGALTVYLYSRKSRVSPDAGEGAKLGALTGLVGGLILLVAGTPLLYFVLRAIATEKIEAQAREVGISLPFGGAVLILIATLILALVGLVVSTLSRMITALLMKRR